MACGQQPVERFVNLKRLSEQQLDYLWSARPHEREWVVDVRAQLKSIFESAELSLANWLLGRCSVREVRAENVRELEALLGTSHTLRNGLRLLTQRVREQLPGFPLASIAIPITRPANPVNPDVYTEQNIQRSNQLVAALRYAYRLNLDDLSDAERVGLLLLSAAYQGGLMDAAQLQAFLASSFDQIEWMAGVPEIRLPLSVQGQDGAEHRQWFPDPGTLAIWYRCSDSLREREAELQRRSEMLRCIRALLLRVGWAKRDLPANLTALLGLLRIQLQLRLPQLIMSYACRDGVTSQSLRPSCWAGMFGHHGVSDPEAAFGPTVKESDPGNEPALAPDWLLSLCRRIRSGHAVGEVGKQDGGDELQMMICDWAEYLITGKSVYGNKLKRSTIARYVRLLGEALVTQLEGLSVFQVELDALENAYEAGIEAQDTDSKRRVLAKAIEEFHAYLEQRHHYPPVSRGCLVAGGQQLASVDARVISEDQYQTALRALERCGLELRTPRLVVAAKIFLILGFRLGLRRNEALKLRLSDVHLPELPSDACEQIYRRHSGRRRLTATELAELKLPVDLLVRPHAQRGLKTQNSVRRLSLRVLLEESELELITQWHRERQAEERRSAYSEFLLCIPEQRTQWVSENTVLPAVHACMRAAGNCDALHFHHLRHSCATWMLLKLVGIGAPTNLALLFRSMPQTARWLADSSRLQAEYVGKGGGPTRRFVHIVSALMGHSSPTVTLRHYVHSLPIVLAMALQWNPRLWSYRASNIAAIAGVSLPTAGYAADDAEHMLHVIGRIKTLKAKKCTARRAGQVRVLAVSQNWVIERIRLIESMLAYATHAESTGQALNWQWLEFSDEERGQMLERARYIRDLPSGSRRRSNTRHRLRNTTYSGRTSLMPMPPKHGGWEGISEYALRLYQVLGGKQHERASRVVDDFVERCWKTETTLRFYRDRDELHASEYLWLLRSVGIPLKSIELIAFDEKGGRTAGNYWRRSLQVTRCPIVQFTPENPDAANTHLGIRATLTLPDKQPNQHSGAALRSLFLMASIDWHFKGAAQHLS